MWDSNADPEMESLVLYVLSRSGASYFPDSDGPYKTSKPLVFVT